MDDGRKSGGWRWIALLCLIAASRWIFEDRWPQSGPTLLSEAIACGVAAVLTFVAALGLRRSGPGWRTSLKLMVVGAGLLAAPAFGAALNGPASNSFNRTVALCFVPTIVTVMNGIWSESAGTWSLWPGLAGLGGALLVFPLVRPSDVPGYVTLLAPPIVVSAACVACRKVAREVPGEWSAAWLLSGGAVGLALLEVGKAAGNGASAQEFSVAAVIVDAVLAGLAVMVILRITALRYASQYFFIPFLTLVEGLLILREGVTLRLGAGLVLLAVAGMALINSRNEGAITNGLGLR